MQPKLPAGEADGKRTSYRPILITLLGAFLLGGGSCVGFVSTLKTLQGKNPPINNIFATMFVVSTLIFLIALLWLIARWIRKRVE